MPRRLPQDTEIAYCWLCRKFHDAEESRCPKNIFDRIGTWLFENWFDLYFKIGIAAIFAAFMYATFAILFNWPADTIPERPPASEETMRKIRDLTH